MKAEPPLEVRINSSLVSSPLRGEDEGRGEVSIIKR